MKIRVIKISDIKIGDRNRQFNAEKANELAKSIEEIGLLHTIVTDNNYNLIAGLHRLKAAEMLGWSEIPCNIFDINNAEEAEIHENLIRAELSELEKADLLCRAKEIYEIKHPESLKANIVKKNLKQFSGKEIISVSEFPKQKGFANSIAENIGLSSRSVRQSIQISKIPQKIKEIIRDTPIADNKTELLTLAKLESDMQKEVTDIISTGRVRKVKEAIYQVRKEDFNRSVVKADTATQDNAKYSNDSLVVSYGDIFRLGDNHIVICGDNTDPTIIEYLSQFHFSFCFADPPYNLGIADYDKAGFIWSQDFLTEISDIVAVTPGINNIESFIKNTSMKYRWLLICHVKNLKSGGSIGYTHYYPVFIFSNLKSVNFGIKDLFDITLPPMPDEDREIANKRQKPAGLLTYMFNGFTKQGDLILDPFAGSGQTLMVCEALGRKCISVEILPEMVQAIIERYETKFNEKAIKIDSLQIKNL
jgi:ParB family chromosome partitioning protein